MIQLFIYLMLLLNLSSCALNKNATLFLREKDEDLSNLKNERCTESGHVIIKAPDGIHYRMITSYGNCDVKKDRKMEEFELEQWGIKRNPKGSIDD